MLAKRRCLRFLLILLPCSVVTPYDLIPTALLTVARFHSFDLLAGLTNTVFIHLLPLTALNSSTLCYSKTFVFFSYRSTFAPYSNRPFSPTVIYWMWVGVFLSDGQTDAAPVTYPNLQLEYFGNPGIQGRDLLQRLLHYSFCSFYSVLRLSIRLWIIRRTRTMLKLINIGECRRNKHRRNLESMSCMSDILKCTQ